MGVLAASLAPDEFYAELGRTLLAWRPVELSAYGILHCLMQPLRSQAIAAVWHSHNGLHQRLDLVSSLLTETLPGDKTVADWKKLRGKIEHASGVRNRLAHSDVAYSALMDGGAYIEAVDFTLTDPAPKRPRATHDLPTADIKAAGSHFRALAQEIRTFEEQLISC